MKKSDRRQTASCDFLPVGWVWLACLFVLLLPLTIKSQSLPGMPGLVPGQTATRLADGRLVLIGVGPGIRCRTQRQFGIRATNRSVQLSARLEHGRAWHSATILPDGLVLILGGIGNDGQLAPTPEIFDPSIETFTSLPFTTISPRAHHTATLLSDGNVLIAGGVGADGGLVQRSELWDVSSPSGTTYRQRRCLDETTALRYWRTVGYCCGVVLTVQAMRLPAARYSIPQISILHRVRGYPLALLPGSHDAPALVASIPLDRSVDIDTETMISLRFSKPLRVETVNNKTISLSGPKGLEAIAVVPAENGSLAFPHS